MSEPTPRRRFVLTATIAGDTLEDVLHEISEMHTGVDRGTMASVGGGGHGSGRWELDDDPTWTHERYMHEIAGDIG